MADGWRRRPVGRTAAALGISDIFEAGGGRMTDEGDDGRVTDDGDG